MESVFPRPQVVDGREGLGHATNPVDGRLELLTKLAAEALALCFLVRNSRQSFCHGLGMDREGLHG
jgi:hypothetical protein